MCELLKWAPFISTIISAFGLIYVGSQYNINNKMNKRNSYLSLLQTYLKFNEIIINKPDIAQIYASKILSTALTEEQKRYIYSVMTFCEAVFLLKEKEPYPEEMPDVSWDGYIINQFKTETIAELWKDIKTQVSTGSMKQEFSQKFVSWIDAQ